MKYLALLIGAALGCSDPAAIHPSACGLPCSGSFDCRVTDPLGACSRCGPDGRCGTGVIADPPDVDAGT